MQSYWEEERKNHKEYESLNNNLNVSVCVIGGGLTGLSTAYYLSNNTSVAVIERNKICGSTSGKNTGKITSQHGIFYKYLIDSQGKEYAKKYLEANEKAINNIENKPIENMGFTKEGNNNTLSIIENEEVKSSSLFENKIKTPFNSNIFSNNNLNNKPSSLNILSHDDNNNTKSINYTVDNTQNNLFNINSNNQTNIISNNDKISEQINFNFSFKNPFQENTVSHSNPLPFSSQPNTSSIITESGQTMKKRAKRRRD